MSQEASSDGSLGTWPAEHTAGRRVLEALARRGAMSVRGLVETLGVTTTAVRQQVKRLHDAGWVLCEKRRGGTGRPADLFSLSPEARRRFGGQRVELFRLLVEELLDAADEEQARALLGRVSRRMAAHTKDAIGNGPIEERLRNLAAYLAKQGDLAEVGDEADGQRLRVYTCPYAGIADHRREICEMERRAFSAVVGKPLRLARRKPDGPHCCEFRTGQTVRGGASSRKAAGDGKRG